MNNGTINQWFVWLGLAYLFALSATGGVNRDEARMYPLSDPENLKNWESIPALTDTFSRKGSKIPDSKKWRRGDQFLGSDVNGPACSNFDPDSVREDTKWDLRNLGSRKILFEEDQITLDSVSFHGSVMDVAKIACDVPASGDLKGGWLQSLAAMKYGYIEIKARTGGASENGGGANFVSRKGKKVGDGKPLVSGSSAFWLMKKTAVDWTEIDIFEIGGNGKRYLYSKNQDHPFLNNQSRFMTSNLHYFEYKDNKAWEDKNKDGIWDHPEETRFHTDYHCPWYHECKRCPENHERNIRTVHFNHFHVYGFEWDESGMRWYLDGALIRSRNHENGLYKVNHIDYKIKKRHSKSAAFTLPMTINMGMEAFADSWFGLPQQSSSFQVDYIKVWKHGGGQNLIPKLADWSGLMGKDRDEAILKKSDEQLIVDMKQDGAILSPNNPYSLFTASPVFPVKPNENYALNLTATSSTTRPVMVKVMGFSNEELEPTEAILHPVMQLVPREDVANAHNKKDDGDYYYNLTFRTKADPGTRFARVELFFGRDSAFPRDVNWPRRDIDAGYDKQGKMDPSVPNRYGGTLVFKDVAVKHLPDRGRDNHRLDGKIAIGRKWLKKDQRESVGPGDLYAKKRDGYVYLGIQAPRLDIRDKVMVFLDTDDNVNTGYRTGETIGADYVIHNNALVKYEGNDRVYKTSNERLVGLIACAVGEDYDPEYSVGVTPTPRRNPKPTHSIEYRFPASWLEMNGQEVRIKFWDGQAYSHGKTTILARFSPDNS